MSNKVFSPDRDYSPDDTAYFLNVTRPTVYKLMNDGLLDSYKAGSARRITGTSIARLRAGKAAA